ncbi:urease subunit gamma [Streptomyces sp. NBC_01693]|uniref:Urease subunit gamma n=1 Tax=Streptomyces sp. gb1(2016) TaxID=1828321 RepID=A0A652L7U1_9ACTN|nr:MULTISPECIES: urease subunit gamma [unclassified Streptomyces]WSS59793.1 urease subunit gamma [Streptomyces sp. NBC_01177]WSS66892.1 urease subunit gamma [Streptomyces sp. NBC_01175]WSS73816.1 urease subunit gamma [Streptomyces sp. NBC_01174]TXS31876.1 urease subunit gamma [Streptomyces sp. gb1(2016)]WSS80776.1 urease subunit gamma [Streptomyces sp. NBC_01174]
MHLIPSEQEKLLLSVAGMLASYRKERGIKLNYPEAVAYISCWVIEEARAGNYTVDQMMSDARLPLEDRQGDSQGEGESVLTRADVMEGVPEMLDVLQVEATFPDGRKLVTLYNPIRDPKPVTKPVPSS